MMNVLECPKDFVCYTSGFQNLCRAKDIGLESFLLCLEVNPLDCKFSLEYGGLFICRCLPRNRIKKELKK